MDLKCNVACRLVMLVVDIRSFAVMLSFCKSGQTRWQVMVLTDLRKGTFQNSLFNMTIQFHNSVCDVMSLFAINILDSVSKQFYWNSQEELLGCSITDITARLTRFNKICHPIQRPRWQVDKEAIGLSRVQQCSSTYNPPS